ncbi:GNAT family N-acetyltransferase [Adhaeretor mobilis]|nr:GNAT family N-acetyltransferase [Adhaeretor mobilis]
MSQTPCPVELELPPMADVVLVDNLEEFQQYRLAWKSLLEETPRASFFMTFDWLETAWKHFGTKQEHRGAKHTRRGDQHDYRVLVVRSDKKPIGFVPLCVVNEQHRVGRVRTLTYPLASWDAWYGPIGPNQAACHWLATQFLAEQRRDWDIVDLRWLDPQQTSTFSLIAAMKAMDMPVLAEPYQESSVIDFDGTWEDYLQTRSSKQRHEMRRKLRHAEELPQVEFIRHRPLSAAEGDGDPRWDLFDTCRDLAARSWQGDSMSGNTISHPQVTEFLHECHAAAARRGMLDVTLLKVAGQPVAYGYNYHYHGKIAGLRMGYAPEFRKQGVGTGLLLMSLRDSFERGDTCLDLGVGGYGFKHRYRTKLEQSYRYTHYPASAWKSQGVRLTKWLKRRVAMSL